MRILVTSDTHVPDFARDLPSALLDEAGAADLVVHAGDVTSSIVLERLAERAPVLAALGNGDGADVALWGAREQIEVDLGGVRTGIVHDSGPSKGRARRMRRRFPDADLVIFGHSHIPLDVEEDGLRLVNPGSPTWKRRQPFATYAVLTIDDGRVRTSFERIDTLAGT